MKYPELEMVFVTSILHVHLMQWEDAGALERAVNTCDAICNSIPQDQRQCCCDLHLYNELLHTFYLLRICDYKEVSNHVNILDVAWQDDMQQME